MTTKKSCWVCRRTEDEVRNECALNPELNEIDCGNWSGIYLCDVCVDVIISMLLAQGFAITSDIEETLEHCQYEVKILPDSK